MVLKEINKASGFFFLGQLLSGVMQFALAIKTHDADPEVKQLSQALQDQFMPKSFAMPSAGATK